VPQPAAHFAEAGDFLSPSAVCRVLRACAFCAQVVGFHRRLQLGNVSRSCRGSRDLQGFAVVSWATRQVSKSGHRPCAGGWPGLRTLFHLEGAPSKLRLGGVLPDRKERSRAVRGLRAIHCARVWRCRLGLSPIAGECQEVKLAGFLKALESSGHGFSLSANRATVCDRRKSPPKRSLDGAPSIRQVWARDCLGRPARFDS